MDRCCRPRDSRLSRLAGALALALGVIAACDPHERTSEEQQELRETRREAAQAITAARDEAAHRVAETQRQSEESVAAVEREAQDDIDEAAADVDEARASQASREHLEGAPRVPATEVVPPPAGGI